MTEYQNVPSGRVDGVSIWCDRCPSEGRRRSITQFRETGTYFGSTEDV